MRKPIIILFLAIFTFSVSQAQNLPLAFLPIVVSEMAAQNTYESPTIGITNVKSKQFARYQQMVSIASEQELVELATNHANAVVRLYAFQALREKAIVISNELQQKFKSDTALVQSIQGCVINKYPLSKLAAKPLPSKHQFSQQQFSPLQFAGQ